MINGPYTEAKEPEASEQDKGVSTVTFTVVIGFIVLLVLVIGGYIVIIDRVNAIDAYRTRELIEQRNGLKTACEINYQTLGKTQALLKQHPEITASLDLMINRPCPLIEPIEKPFEIKE